MTNFAKSLDLTMIEIIGDGNCWAEALAQEERRIRPSSTATHSTVRAAAVKYIRENKEHFMHAYQSKPDDSDAEDTEEQKSQRFDFECQHLSEDFKWSIGDSNLPDFLVESYAKVASLNVKIYVSGSSYSFDYGSVESDYARLALLQYKNIAHFNVLRETKMGECTHDNIFCFILSQ
jgi:hypothetical protein